MGLTPRHFFSNKLYAITFRTKKGLPFVSTRTIRTILEGAIARTQRDFKVTLCHFLWMGNHAHILAIFHDAQQASNFYGEVQKKITDSLKPLLGLRNLNLWAGRPVVAQVFDIDAAIDQIVYLYANPTRANLVDSITEYPGSSSWRDYIECTDTVEAKVSHDAVWVPYPRIKKLPSPVMKKQADEDFNSRLTAAGVPHKLELFPNAWMKLFGVINPEHVREVNHGIQKRLRAREELHRKTRREEKKSVFGERALRLQSIWTEHTPKPSERRIFIISSSKEERIEYLQYFRTLCTIARECYLDALKGIHRLWPPGMFRPPLPHSASAIA